MDDIYMLASWYTNLSPVTADYSVRGSQNQQRRDACGWYYYRPINHQGIAPDFEKLSYC
jgi:hypothetical protein